MKQVARSRRIVPLDVSDRVSTGVVGLDELIEGGLPRGSMTILAGSPGSGKTIASAQFLYHGAKECAENGIYVSLSERKEVFMRNMERFGLDFAPLEKQGSFRFLDFATTREAGVSSILNAVLKEAFSIKAERLVVDSFSALSLAFEKMIDARVVLHAFEKLMRQVNCTTLLLVEVPTGNSSLGLGFEEFVADALILFEIIEDEVGIKKRAIIRKMRGTDHNQNYSNIVVSDQGVVLTPYVT